jgi:hypothetical protein
MLGKDVSRPCWERLPRGRGPVFQLSGRRGRLGPLSSGGPRSSQQRSSAAPTRGSSVPTKGCDQRVPGECWGRTSADRAGSDFPVDEARFSSSPAVAVGSVRCLREVRGAPRSVRARPLRAALPFRVVPRLANCRLRVGVSRPSTLEARSPAARTAAPADSTPPGTRPPCPRP